MSYDESDAQWDRMWEAADEALYPEHFDRAIEEFTTDRLQSFYMAHRDVAREPIAAFSKARALLPDHPEAALVFAAVAVEVGLRAALLRPITHGLVHNEDLADAVADLFMETRPSLDRLRTLFLRILAEHGVNLDKDHRPGTAEALWPEMKRLLQEERNDVLHRALSVSLGIAERAVAIAAHFLDVVFPHVLARLELNLGPGGLVSCDTGWQVPLRRGYRLDAGRLYGPCAGGQYALHDDGRFFEGSSDTGFYVAGGRVYGPSRRPPWVQAREELAALLKATRDGMTPPATRPDALRRFFHALFTSHVLAYAPVEDGPPEAFGIVTTPTGRLLVGAYVDWGLVPVSAIRAFEAAAHVRGVGGLYVSLTHFDSPAFSLAPASTGLPVVLVEDDELRAIADGHLLLSEAVDRKLAAARVDGRMYLPVRAR